MEKRSHFLTIALCLLPVSLLATLGCKEKPAPAPVVSTEDATYQGAPGESGGMPESDSFTPVGQAQEDQAIDTELLLEACLNEEQLKEGWVNLFDGQTPYGWFSIGGARWGTKDGVLRADSGEPSFLCTSFQIADYELLVDFKCAADTNSGVFLRTTANPQDVTHECYELNIAPPDNPFPTGSLVKRKKVDPEVIGDVAADTWHTYRVLADGDSIKVWLDGKSVLEYTDPKPLRRGYISLQYNSGPIEFRNILMRPLGLKQLPVGSDWETAWTKGEKPGAKFTVTGDDAGLQLKGGSGRVESKEQWDDFVLQATYQLATPSVNSGIFFRCVPGSITNGYECQLNHDFKAGGRVMPLDYGAGGIFNRQVARIVVGNGTEPTYVTVLAEEFQLATWINGLQIADFADTRPRNPNPRLGARREPGTLALQGHDESTQVLFKQIGIAPIAANPASISPPPASETQSSDAQSSESKPDVLKESKN